MSAITSETLFDKLRPIIMDVTGVPELIRTNDNAISPAGSYATLNVDTNVRQSGQPYISFKAAKGGGPLQAFATSRMISRCDLNFYHLNALDHARRMKLIGRLPKSMGALEKAELGINFVGQVSDVTFLQAHRMEPRAHVYIEVMYEIDSLTEVKEYGNVDFEVINDVRTEHALAVPKPVAFEPWAWGQFYSGQAGYGDMVPIDKALNIRLLRKSEDKARVLVYVQNDMGQNDNVSEITLNGGVGKKQWRTSLRARVHGLPAVRYVSMTSTAAKDVIITITTK